MKTSIALLAVLFSAVTSLALADTFGSGANTFNIEFVNIGNPGNAADTVMAGAGPNLAGSVAQVYRIGKFEIPEQMIDKANALGGLAIPKDTFGPDKPVTSVSWNEAARFVNWLNTSTGSAPAYKFTLQPGEVGYDPNANIELWTPSDAGYNPNNLYRNSLARYFLPSVDEWYKAAYYDPTNGVYYDFPTGSDSIPDGIDFAGDPNFEAVFTDGFQNTQPNDITNVGLLSPYGTAGQGGNVWEMMETEFDMVNDSSSTPRERRGGSVYNEAIDLHSSVWFTIGSPTNGGLGWGFRVASADVPEPSTLLLLCFGSLAVLWRRRALR